MEPIPGHPGNLGIQIPSVRFPPRLPASLPGVIAFAATLAASLQPHEFAALLLCRGRSFVGINFGTPDPCVSGKAALPFLKRVCLMASAFARQTISLESFRMKMFDEGAAGTQDQ